MKRIPYGISNFKSLVEENYYYVDKTKYIEILENFNEKYIVFLRPRRFGKSLFISKLEYYYDRIWKDENLFSEYYIGKNPTKLKSSYYVLVFTFSGINTDTEANTNSGFKSNIINALELFLAKYKIDIKLDENKTAVEISDYFFNKVKSNLDGKIYLLIYEDGYIDIVLQKGSIPKPKYFAMMELKYIPMKDYSEVEKQKKLLDAKAQLAKYVQAEELRNMPNMKKWAFVFSGDKCVAVEELELLK